MKKLLYIILCGYCIACSPKNKSEEPQDKDPDSPEAALMDEVMELHDEAMIPWGEIHDLDKQLDTKINELDSTQDTDGIAQKYQHIKLALEEADDAMMAWMRDFKPDKLQEMDVDSAIIILEQKKSSMEEVFLQVNSSVDSAKALLKAY